MINKNHQKTVTDLPSVEPTEFYVPLTINTFCSTTPPTTVVYYLFQPLVLVFFHNVI